MASFCQNCGSPLEEKANFCANCGQAVSPEPTTSPVLPESFTPTGATEPLGHGESGDQGRAHAKGRVDYGAEPRLLASDVDRYLAIFTLGFWLLFRLSRRLWRRGQHRLAVALVAVPLSIVAVVIAAAAAPGPDSTDDLVATPPTTTAASSVPKASAKPKPTQYTQLLAPGMTAREAALATCAGYTGPIDATTRNSARWLPESVSAASDPYAASDYAGTATWLGVHHLSALQRRIHRISLVALRKATHHWSLPAPMISNFTAVALRTCGLATEYQAARSAARQLDVRAAAITVEAANVPWYPEGFHPWGDGSVAFQFVDNPNCPDTGAYCWQMRVISENDCSNGLYAEMNIVNGGTVIDYTNATLGSLPANTPALLTFESFTASGSSKGQLQKINCY